MVNGGLCMVKAPIERLTARHRDCLRLVGANHSTKEIALALRLSPNTVDGYISGAKEIMGAATRRDAARAFQAFCLSSDPLNLGGKFSRVVSADIAPPHSLGEHEASLRFAASVAPGLPLPKVGGRFENNSFHLFRGVRERNSLSSRQRLIWIALGSLIAAMILVAGVTSIDTLARLSSHRPPWN
jgi:DNA-binding CsgD family transcriptional regulator